MITLSTAVFSKIQVRYRKSPRDTCITVKLKTNANPPDPNRYRRRCPDPNARIQKFMHYMAIATFAIADCHLFEH